MINRMHQTCVLVESRQSNPNPGSIAILPKQPIWTVGSACLLPIVLSRKLAVKANHVFTYIAINIGVKYIG